ncbi:S-methyl-5'-thioinosine phosphorylase [Pseudohongiella sp.]|uniref:Nucleoside phosphorylase domain-containing protein n=1 Tax=marine sediment metagenome TaxID=412755 RepID=A0A0F9W350_9ZZZZ|nr:S-methyl-5'-thioinosine phosphorylase [Pseudohongiella sp.]HDZ09079.1 S-methyl-5'-thioinosine phosphorylase [Pseudohongiella sp.]HEA63585.1 S-methyl-5'-thioinosine phosphorylase [Pseudohongiella sp.]
MLAFIGGTGLNQLPGFEVKRIAGVQTPYQDTAVDIACGHLPGVAGTVHFLPRHGEGHTVPPHRINYRANMFALRELGVTSVLAVNAVGGIHRQMGPGVIAVPEQIIDYTSGRAHTFFDGDAVDIESADRFTASVTHIDFTRPYSHELRELLLASAGQLQLPVWPHGVYGATQGPRLETIAEVRRLQNDGCDMVGMTGMPEAALARELGLAYASVCLSVNWAAGLSDDVITMPAIRAVLAQGMDQIHRLLLTAASRFPEMS